LNIDNEHLDTDAAWEQWGQRDPYFGVITNPKFRRNELTADGKHEFFESGRLHVDYLLYVIHRHLDPQFAPRSILDFGCGVGRTLPAFADIARDVVGLDVSPSMLDEAERNCRDRGLQNVRLMSSDDALSATAESFDMIHSCIVFQHIPIPRGKLIFQRLLSRLAPRGVGAFQFLYSKAQYAENFGIPPRAISGSREQRPRPPPDADPEMQMNPYNMNEILFLTQAAGARRLYTDFTDHGGELGLFIFFQLS
jgi:SAM-dependent methyltransferase